jgi:steroid 5-alpha reductase family enzyme
MEYLVNVAFVIWLYMTIVFFLALIRKDNSIVDVFWGLGFIVVAAFSLVKSGNFNIQTLVMNLMVLVWGLRLSIHIFLRNRGKGEDFRYKAWRDTWKYFVLRSYFQIFILQGIFLMIVSSPVYFVNQYSDGVFHVYDYIGIILFLTGFYFEAVSDYQLFRFTKNPEHKGKIITTGLWSISRHPNYFGEALIWWGIGCFALSYYQGWIMLVSPLIITYLLRFVSGVPMLEKKYQTHPDWSEYKKKTAVFVPFLKFL